MTRRIPGDPDNNTAIIVITSNRPSNTFVSGNVILNYGGPKP